MAKDKKASKAAASAPKPAASKPLESVKEGRVSKSASAPKGVAKEAAKKIEKKSKKAKKEPTPEPSSDEDDNTSASSMSSDDGSESDEEDVAPKTNGKAAAALNGDDDSGSDESSEASDSDELDAKAGAEGKKVEDDSSEDGSSASEDEAGGGAPKAKINGHAKEHAADSSEASSSDDDDEDSADEEEEAKPKVEDAAGKKRKAEGTIEQTPKKSKAAVDGENKDASGNLFIGNLSWNIDEEWLTREFEEFGEIKSVRIITDRDSGRSKGFGYVEFVEVDAGVAALEEKNESLLDGRNIRVDFSVPRQPRDNAQQTPQQRSQDRAKKFGDVPNEPSSTLFVGNIAFSVDEATITECFAEYGDIKAVRLPTDRDSGALKGYGYVEMSSTEEAKGALEALQGVDVAGRSLRLDFATPRAPNDSPRGGFGGGFGGRGGGGGGGRGRGGFGDRGGRGRGGFGDRGRGGRGRGNSSFNRGGFGDFSGKKTSF